MIPELGVMAAHVCARTRCRVPAIASSKPDQREARHRMAAIVPARTDRCGCTLAASALALALGAGARLAEAQSPKLEAAYVVLGPQGAVARAVLAQASSCPTITIDGAQQPMSVRALPDADVSGPGLRANIPAGATSASLENSPLPLPKTALKSIAAFGDTGCRLKVREDARRRKATPTTMTLAANSRIATFRRSGHSRRWPRASTDAKPDLVIHVGDYLYRESACPPGDAGCARSPYGDDWPTWKADFFAPAAPALLRGAVDRRARQSRNLPPRRPGLFPPARSDAGSDAPAQRRRHAST